jgi:hypothetical protein
LSVDLCGEASSTAWEAPPEKYERRRHNLAWVQPTLIAEIEYRAWRNDGKLRHAFSQQSKVLPRRISPFRRRRPSAMHIPAELRSFRAALIARLDLVPVRIVLGTPPPRFDALFQEKLLEKAEDGARSGVRNRQ